MVVRAAGLRDPVPVEPAPKTGDQICGKVLYRNRVQPDGVRYRADASGGGAGTWEDVKATGARNKLYSGRGRRKDGIDEEGVFMAGRAVVGLSSQMAR